MESITLQVEFASQWKSWQVSITNNLSSTGLSKNSMLAILNHNYQLPNQVTLPHHQSLCYWNFTKYLSKPIVPPAQIRELEEKLRHSLSESARRESFLLMRLNSKEQEMQDLIVSFPSSFFVFSHLIFDFLSAVMVWFNSLCHSQTIWQVQIQELKASQAASTVTLRSSLLDPAVNLLIQQLRKELEKAKSALEETQNELSAWKFTPDRLDLVFFVFVFSTLNEFQDCEKTLWCITFWII